MEKDIQNRVRSWLRDDEGAFKEIFTYYYPLLYRYNLRYLRNETLSEDLTMEVLTKIWEKKAAIVDPGTFENYLFTAARNRLINHWQRRIDGLLSLDVIRPEEGGAPGVEPVFIQDVLLSKELESVYRKSLSDLPEKRRIIFQMHRNEQLSYKEIAGQLNISPKTVENQISAALKQLRVAMLQYLTSIIL
ncbi:MAG: RNA polymerase sigma-70 factor [Chitinophagaceae bacterium]|nr:RNA polymerase sigma-70 factor [Chitinophagaceae bacterium]